MTIAEEIDSDDMEPSLHQSMLDIERHEQFMGYVQFGLVIAAHQPEHNMTYSRAILLYNRAARIKPSNIPAYPDLAAIDFLDGELGEGGRIKPSWASAEGQ